MASHWRRFWPILPTPRTATFCCPAWCRGHMRLSTAIGATFTTRMIRRSCTICAVTRTSGTNLAGDDKYAQIKATLQAAGPESFAEPGPARNQLKLIIDGERFHWEPKKPRRS